MHRTITERSVKCLRIEKIYSFIKLFLMISSSISRVRAWLRLAVMQKKLSDYFQIMIESKVLIRYIWRKFLCYVFLFIESKKNVPQKPTLRWKIAILLLRDYYEEWALLRNETSGTVFVGSLIGLRVLDCNLYLKEEDLIKQVSKIVSAIFFYQPSVDFSRWM